MSTPRAAAVRAMVHHNPDVPHTPAAQAASGSRNAVMLVLSSMGTSVHPAPAMALSSTTSAPRNSCENAEMRR